MKQEDRPLVRSRMIRALVYVLVNNVNGEFLDPIDYKIFPDYIMPSLFEKYFENEEELMDIDDEIIRYLGKEKLPLNFIYRWYCGNGWLPTIP